MSADLSPLERLTRAIHLQEVDRPPCICPGGMMNMVVEDVMDLTKRPWPQAHLTGEAMAELASGHYHNGGFENYGVPFCMTVEAQSMGAPVSMGDRIHEPRVTSYVIERSQDWDRLTPIDLSSGRALEVCRAISILKSRGLEVPVIANLTGPVSLATSLVDPAVFYKDIRKNPSHVEGLMDRVTEELIRFGRAQLEAGADVLTISDPSGTGEILGPKAFETFAIPYLNRILDSLAPLAKGTIVHICGRLKGVAHLLGGLHCDCVSFDSISSARDIASHVEGKSLMGNVSTLAIETAAPGQLRLLCQSSLNQGIHVLAPACGIGAMTALDQVRIMVDVAKNTRRA